MNQKRILIFGVGAVGSVFGVKLAETGNDVYFYAKEHQRKKLREKGLTIETFFFKKKTTLYPIKLLENFSEIKLFDYIIICTRFDQIQDSLKELKQAGLVDIPVVTLQTGIEQIDADERDLIIFAPSLATYRIENKIKYFIPHVIPTMIGTSSGEIDLKIQKLKEIFDNAGIQAKISKDIFFEISSFLAILIPLTAIAILSDSSVKNLLKNIGFIKDGIKGAKEVFRIVHEKYQKTSLFEIFFKIIPEFLLIGFIWLAVLLTKSVSGPLIENYSKAMKEQIKLILDGFISESKKYKIDCPVIDNILQEINKVTLKKILDKKSNIE